MITKQAKQTKKTFSQFEITKRRQESLRKLRIFEIVSIVVLLAVTLGLALMLPWGVDGDSERISTLMLVIGGAIALQSAVMIRQGYLRFKKGDEVNKDSEDHFFRGWRFTYWSPLMVLAILSPWLISGTFNADDVTAIGAVFMLLLIYYAALLIGFIIVPFIFLPIELIVRALYALIVKRDASKIGYLYIGGFISLVTTFILVMSAATRLDHPGVVGGAAGIPALLGLPGAYDVENEPLLWVGRGIAFILIGIGVAVYVQGKRNKKQK